MLLDSSGELLGPLVNCVDVTAAPSDPGHLQVSPVYQLFTYISIFTDTNNWILLYLGYFVIILFWRFGKLL